MIRARFKACPDDFRPVVRPVKHPYWCTGYGEDSVGEHSIIVAYADDLQEIHRLWPESYDIDSRDVDGYTFTDRFPKPDWFEVTP